MINFFDASVFLSAKWSAKMDKPTFLVHRALTKNEDEIIEALWEQLAEVENLPARGNNLIEIIELSNAFGKAREAVGRVEIEHEHHHAED